MADSNSDLSWVQRVTVAETIKVELVSLCPDFAAVWDNDRRDWIDDHGEFTVYGLFGVFSRYIRDRLAESAEPDLRRVFEYIE